LQQPEQFICISYSQIDFLIPNEYVVSAVGIKDVQLSLMSNQNSSFFDFDDLAIGFHQYARPSHVKTLIVLKYEENNISIVTTQECKVCTINYNAFSLFSDFYADALKEFGFLACLFEDDRMKILLDAKQTIDFMNNSLLEVL